MSGEWDEFDLAVARWRIGDIETSELPEAAMHALAAGADSPTLSRLAAEADGDPKRIRELLASVFAERDLEIPVRSDPLETVAPDDEALKLIVDDVLGKVARNRDRPETAFLQLEELLLDQFHFEDGDDEDGVAELYSICVWWDEPAQGPAGTPEGEIEYTPDELRAWMLKATDRILANGGIQLRD